MTDIDCLSINAHTTLFDCPNTSVIIGAAAGNMTMRIKVTPEGFLLNLCLECRFGTEFCRKVVYAIFKKGKVCILMHVHS